MESSLVNVYFMFLWVIKRESLPLHRKRKVIQTFSLPGRPDLRLMTSLSRTCHFRRQLTLYLPLGNSLLFGTGTSLSVISVQFSQCSYDDSSETPLFPVFKRSQKDPLPISFEGFNCCPCLTFSPVNSMVC